MNNPGELLLIALGLATPLIFAMLGGYASERGGVINIGLEGMMLVSACVSALVGVAHGPGWGLAAGILAAVGLSLLHWLATQIYRIDQVISGMAINAIAAGATNFLNQKFASGSSSTVFPELPYHILAIVAVGLAALISMRTRFGLRLIAVGADPIKARLVGLDPVRIRLIAALATGLLTGLAGNYLVAETGVFTDNMTAGRGYIALAALILAGWRPVPGLIAALVFGFLSALSIKLQGQAIAGVVLPGEFWTSVPYLLTVLAMAGFVARNRTPAGLGKY
jgi:simple sugar transport system permease protein